MYDYYVWFNVSLFPACHCVDTYMKNPELSCSVSEVMVGPCSSHRHTTPQVTCCDKFECNYICSCSICICLCYTEVANRFALCNGFIKLKDNLHSFQFYILYSASCLIISDILCTRHQLLCSLYLDTYDS